VSSSSASAKTIETQFARIQYSDDQHLNDFVWRVTGRRLEAAESENAAKARVDELVDRVESLLDMRTNALHFDIVLEPVYAAGNIAFYSHEKKSIRVFVNRVTDGVLAHEIAHAVICHYFPVPPPERTQEILAQYVDQHLWNEPV
jgi:hypothetical protein